MSKEKKEQFVMRATCNFCNDYKKVAGKIAGRVCCEDCWDKQLTPKKPKPTKEKQRGKK